MAQDDKKLLSKTSNNHLFNTLKLAWFLAVRQIRRAHLSTTLLIICIMTLTFLNLVVVSGILVGLIQGAVEAVGERYLGDVFISNLKDKTYITHSEEIINTAKSLPGVKTVTARYLESGTIEANYKTRKRDTDIGEVAGTSIAGIDPVSENEATGLADLVIEGEYLDVNDYDKVLVGAMLLKQYLDFESPNFPVLSNVNVGTRVRVEINGSLREVTVKGITKSKVDEIDRRVFFVDRQLRGLIGRTDYNVDEIVLKLAPGASATAVKNSLLKSGFGDFAKIQTRDDAEPKFIKDMKATFATLGAIISSIGLVVASITIFIVIFINAITRRKFIGILKGIGIKPKAIEAAYVLQSIFYGVIGTALGCLLVFGLLKPYLDAHPINFPFSDGILVATLSGTIWRIVTLLLATIIAGYIPARMVVKQNTLDAILGR